MRHISRLAGDASYNIVHLTLASPRIALGESALSFLPPLQAQGLVRGALVGVQGAVDHLAQRYRAAGGR